MHWGMARIKHFWHSSKSKITPFSLSQCQITLVRISYIEFTGICMRSHRARTHHLKRKMNITYTPIELATLSQQWLWTINAVPVYIYMIFPSFTGFPLLGKKNAQCRELKLMLKFITATMRRITTTATSNNNDEQHFIHLRWWWRRRCRRRWSWW